MTERQRQKKLEHMSALIEKRPPRFWVFFCENGEPFSAIATSRGGALRVFNAERPGVHVDWNCFIAAQPQATKV